MKKSLATLLTALILFSCAMAETGGLDLNREVKPATAFTAQANAAVYDELDFSDKQEYAFATRGLIDAPETLELKEDVYKRQRKPTAPLTITAMSWSLNSIRMPVLFKLRSII